MVIEIIIRIIFTFSFTTDGKLATICLIIHFVMVAADNDKSPFVVMIR